MANQTVFLYNKPKKRRPRPETLQLTGPLYEKFMDQVPSEVTGKNYTAKLRGFMMFLHMTRVEELLPVDRDATKIENQIIEFIRFLRHTRGQSLNSQRGYVVGLTAFYKFADWKMSRDINWEQIWRYVGSSIRKDEDRPYKAEQIHKMLQIADEREAVVLLMFCSTGIRLGALHLIRLGDLTKIAAHDIYKIDVYSGFDEHYITFCSRECAKSIDRYIDYRVRFGERLLDKDGNLFDKDNRFVAEAAGASLIRNQFNINDPADTINPDPNRLDKYGNPKPYRIEITERIIQHIISKLIIKAGLRQKINTKANNGMFSTRTHHQIHQIHGLRKFFATQLELARLRDQSIERLLGHGVKKTLRGIYRKVEEDELLADYMSGEAYLTIEEQERLREKVKKLTAEQDRIMKKLNKIDALAEKLGITDDDDDADSADV
jgi:integrase